MAALAEGPHDDCEVERLVLTGDDGAPIPAVRARPGGMPRAGIVLHPDVMGLRPLVDDLVRRLATHGFAAIAVEPFARPLQDGAAGLDDAAVRLAHVKDLDDSLQIGDLERAADRLVVDDGVGSVGALGFCMGGLYTFLAAASGRFDRAVACYGMLRVPPDWGGAGHRSPLDVVAGVCPTLAVFGDQDPWVPMADVDALRAVWAGRDDCEIIVYPGADHGFVHDPERPTHRAGAAADVWARALRFLGG